jgi:formylglycine-generating enzyme
MLRTRAALFVALLATSGCGLVLGLRDGIVDEDAGGSGVPDARDDVTLADAADAAPGPDGSARDAPTDTTPQSRGPRCIPVGNDAGISFCIDETEVTDTQYRAMLDDLADGGSPTLDALNATLPPTGCTTFPTVVALYPSSGPPAKDDFPVVNVGWCQAHVFCAWAGKHMCGAMGGGAGDQSTRQDPAASEWFFACSQNGTQNYPYGGAAGQCFVCNDNANCDAGADATPAITPIESWPSCKGSYGVYDLTGNVSEWENSYQLDAAITSRYASVRGGSFVTNYGDGCRYDHGTDWGNASLGDIWTGIRCCR